MAISITAINAAKTGGTLDVGAALNGSGNLVLTGTNGVASITVGGTSTADTAIGFGAGANSFQPVNLLTQGAVAQGDTISVSVAGGTPTVITFGTNTGAGQVATLAQLQAAIGVISGLTGTVDTATGNITLTSNSNIVLDGSPTTLLAGIWHPQCCGLSGQCHGDRQRYVDLHRPIRQWRFHHRLRHRG